MLKVIYSQLSSFQGSLKQSLKRGLILEVTVSAIHSRPGVYVSIQQTRRVLVKLPSQKCFAFPRVVFTESV